MIRAADDRLFAWAQQVLGGEAQVTIGPPSNDREGVSLYLFALAGAQPLRGAQLPPFALKLRYLISTWYKDQQQAHDVLSSLVFAAMEEEGFEVEVQPLSLEDWRAFAATPRPCFSVLLPVQKARVTPQAKMVTDRLVVDLVPARPLSGVVFGPEKRAIAGAVVEIPALSLRTSTDANGRFRFERVPATRDTTLSVAAKGWQRSLLVDPNAASSDLIVQLEPMEE